MLDQASRAAGEVETLLLDGNYAYGPVLAEALERDVDVLTPLGAPKTKKQDKKNCRVCPFRAHCIGGKTQKYRKVRRYATDDLMSALQMVMAQPRARSQLAKRGAWVEPVFSEMKGVQRLSRFKRFGLRGARVEFAIHACAYNLRRLVAAMVAIYMCFCRIQNAVFALWAYLRPSPTLRIPESVKAEFAL